MEGRDTDGKFQKGHPGYKPKGSVNEFQKVTREKLGQFLKEKLSDLDAIYDELGPRDKARLIMAMVEYYLPKQREMIVDVTEGSRTFVDYSLISETSLKEILNATRETDIQTD